MHIALNVQALSVGSVKAASSMLCGFMGNQLSTDLLRSDLILFPFLWPVPTADYLSLSNTLSAR